MGKTKEKAPKTYPVRLTTHAQQNINEITGYIAFINHQPLNAIRIGDKIFDTIDRIRQNPYIFRECEEIPTKNKIYRKAVCQNWLIIYRIKSDEVVILGIIYGSRKPSHIKKLRKVN